MLGTAPRRRRVHLHIVQWQQELAARALLQVQEGRVVRRRPHQGRVPFRRRRTVEHGQGRINYVWVLRSKHT